MTKDEIQEKINSLTGKKKKLDGSRTLSAFLFCIFLFDWDKFMAGEPSKLLMVIFAVITVIPLGLIIYETKIIRGIKNQIAELTSKLSNEDNSEDDANEGEE